MYTHPVQYLPQMFGIYTFDTGNVMNKYISAEVINNFSIVILIYCLSLYII